MSCNVLSTVADSDQVDHFSAYKLLTRKYLREAEFLGHTGNANLRLKFRISYTQGRARGPMAEKN